MRALASLSCLSRSGFSFSSFSFASRSFLSLAVSAAICLSFSALSFSSWAIFAPAGPSLASAVRLLFLELLNLRAQVGDLLVLCRLLLLELRQIALRVGEHLVALLLVPRQLLSVALGFLQLVRQLLALASLALAVRLGLLPLRGFPLPIGLGLLLLGGGRRGLLSLLLLLLLGRGRELRFRRLLLRGGRVGLAQIADRRRIDVLRLRERLLDRLGRHGRRNLGRRTDVERLREVAHARVHVLVLVDLEHAEQDVDLRHDPVRSQAALLRDRDRLLELALRLVEVAVCIRGRGALAERLQLLHRVLRVGRAGVSRRGEQQELYENQRDNPFGDVHGIFPLPWPRAVGVSGIYRKPGASCPLRATYSV